MQAARASGSVVSFDLNFRPRLWQARGGRDKAVDTLRKIVSYVDVLVGNEEDLQNGLGLSAYETSVFGEIDPDAYLRLIDETVRQFANVKVVATTLREVHSANHHKWSALAWIDGQSYHAPSCELDIYDRIGGGDGFAAGLIYGLIDGALPQQAVDIGWALGALLTTTPGDTAMVNADQVFHFARGGSARVQR
jgi:2-dehydro-3-deoxygluconokinase